jgi:hypothetical protein
VLWIRQFSSRVKKPHPERSLVGGERSPIEVWHAPMRDDEVQSYITYGGTSHFEMDDAFCARMCAAIEAGWKARLLVSSPGPEREIQYTSRTTVLEATPD